jgi:hypothetical protein
MKNFYFGGGVGESFMTGDTERTATAGGCDRTLARVSVCSHRLGVARWGVRRCGLACRCVCAARIGVSGECIIRAV